MFIYNYISDGVSSLTKRFWPEAKEAETKTEAVAAPNAAPEAKSDAVNNYYVDTIAKAESGFLNINEPYTGTIAVTTDKGIIESRLSRVSSKFDEEIANEVRDYERLQALVYQVIMMMMRLAAKADQENIREITVKITTKAEEIKGTYNNYMGISITVISSAISFGGAAAGLAPFFPFFSAATATTLSSASQAIGSAGTGVSGLSQITNNKYEGLRQVLQIQLKRHQDTEEERKGSKHNKGDLIKTAKASAEEFQRAQHDARRTVAGG